MKIYLLQVDDTQRVFVTEGLESHEEETGRAHASGRWGQLRELRRLGRLRRWR